MIRLLVVSLTIDWLFKMITPWFHPSNNIKSLIIRSVPKYGWTTTSYFIWWARVTTSILLIYTECPSSNNRL